jgi:nucleolar protein 56
MSHVSLYSNYRHAGEQLRDQVEERLKFYDTGDAPRKNVDVMSAVAESLRKISTKSDKASKKARKSTGGDEEVVIEEKKEKKEKKDKKRGIDAVEAEEEPVAEDEGKKKKKKKVSRPPIPLP